MYLYCGYNPYLQICIFIFIFLKCNISYSHAATIYWICPTLPYTIHYTLHYISYTTLHTLQKLLDTLPKKKTNQHNLYLQILLYIIVFKCNLLHHCLKTICCIITLHSILYTTLHTLRYTLHNPTPSLGALQKQKKPVELLYFVYIFSCNQLHVCISYMLKH